MAATASCPTANKVGTNPLTGATYSYALQGMFDPASYSGAPFSGIVQCPSASKNYFNTPSLACAPRVGSAYDLFGNGKTAIRGGFGIFYGRAFGVDALAERASASGRSRLRRTFLLRSF